MRFFRRNKEEKKTSRQSNPVSEATAFSEVHMNTALSFYEEKNYEAAFDLFKLVAENTDNSKAQYNLGSLYAQGLGTKQNYVEAAYWFNRAFQNGEEGADKLLNEFGVSLAMVTLGPKGCLLKTKNAACKVNSPTVSPVDTTGAGDIFGGSAIYRLLELNKPIEKLTADDLCYIGAFASTAASLSTEQSGGIPSIPEKSAVLAAM